MARQPSLPGPASVASPRVLALYSQVLERSAPKPGETWAGGQVPWAELATARGSWQSCGAVPISLYPGDLKDCRFSGRSVGSPKSPQGDPVLKSSLVPSSPSTQGPQALRPSSLTCQTHAGPQLLPRSYPSPTTCQGITAKDTTMSPYNVACMCCYWGFPLASYGCQSFAF